MQQILLNGQLASEPENQLFQLEMLIIGIFALLLKQIVLVAQWPQLMYSIKSDKPSFSTMLTNLEVIMLLLIFILYFKTFLT